MIEPVKGHIRHHFSETDSTNVRARFLSEQGSPEWTIVTADFQSMGRGRRGNIWISESGQNLLLSVILRPQRAMEYWGCIPLLVGVAVVDALAEAESVGSQLKWPNDIMVDSRKLGGVLIETGETDGQRWMVAGIGLNVNQTVFPPDCKIPPTSLAMETGKKHGIDSLIPPLLDTLGSWYRTWNDFGNAKIIAAWKERTNMIGKTVLIQSGTSKLIGTMHDIAADGSMVLYGKDGTKRNIFAGDVTILSMNDSE